MSDFFWDCAAAFLMLGIVFGLVLLANAILRVVPLLWRWPRL